MHYSWDAILHNVARIIREATGVTVGIEELVAPPDPKLGDVAFGCFKIAKQQKKNPAEVAKELAIVLKQQDLSVEAAVAAGPYVNISFTAGDVIARIVKDVEVKRAEFGTWKDEAKGQVVFEYANPNTHKEIHIGHLRNFILGASLCRILSAAGWNMVPVSYVNDMGTNVAKCLWKLVRVHGFTPESFSATDLTALLHRVDRSSQNGKYLGTLYTEATREIEEHEELKAGISCVHSALERHDPVWTQLWSETRLWCLEELRQIFADLGVMVERQYFESQCVDRSQEIVGELEKRGIATKSQGALIVDLEQEKLGIVVIRKSDGALLYIAKDLALAEQKMRDYPDARIHYTVTDKRQELNFKQLFVLLRVLGHAQQFGHIGYELVTLKEGAMSSRKGNIVTWQQFRDDVLAYATEETQARHPEWNEGKVTHTAWCLMMGGIKFGLLRQDPDKIYIFDKEQALSFDGATGPYIQYAATRLGSILRKAEWKPDSGTQAGDLTVLAEPVEKRVALAIAQLPGVIRKAAEELRPSLVAQWCLEMATVSNEFYRDVKVLDAEERVRAARLRLVAAARSALLLGLSHLGIPVPEEM